MSSMMLGAAESANPPTDPQDGSFVLAGARYIGRDYYIYSATASLDAGGTGFDNIQIEADSDFIWQKATYTALAKADPEAVTESSRIIPAATVLLTDTGSGRQLSDEAQNIPGMFGTGELPFILPTPRLMQARTTLQVAFSNLDQNTGVDIRLMFIGYKAYRAGPNA